MHCNLLYYHLLISINRRVLGAGVDLARMVSCSLCGKTIEETSSIIDEVIEGRHHTFDNEDCILMFKKLESVYGKEHFIIEC